MVVRLCLVVGLVLVVVASSGCSYFGRNCGCYEPMVERSDNLWRADINVGLATPDRRCVPAVCTPLAGEWGRRVTKTEQFFGTYFFNYDPHDPYRGDDLGDIGDFVGTNFLLYDTRDPYRGDCSDCGYYCTYPLPGCR